MLELIKKIRSETGAGVIDIKKALEEANGSEKDAVDILRRRGLEKAGKKGSREAKEGVIVSYVHTNGKVAVLVKVLCETDFVARNDEFKELANDLAMQIAAMDPKSVSPEDIPQLFIDEHKKDWKKEAEDEKKPEDITKKIIEGKEQRLRNENALLAQAFIKDQDKTVEEVIKGKIAKMGENIKVEEFVRLEL
ncbi:MAG: elongation factor Ts [Patescibacteria group bacterium]|nr:elongation factor Ts [Patescibacteria group bacterium]